MKVQAKSIIHDHVVDELDNEKLTIGKIYDVIGLEGEYYRIINDSNEPILYTKELFEIIDSNIPADWIETKFDDEIFVEPIETSKPGFYEDFFDDEPNAVQIYNMLLKKLGIR